MSMVNPMKIVEETRLDRDDYDLFLNLEELKKREMIILKAT